MTIKPFFSFLNSSRLFPQVSVEAGLGSLRSPGQGEGRERLVVWLVGGLGVVLTGLLMAMVIVLQVGRERLTLKG